MNERELRQMASYMPRVNTSRVEALTAIACAAGLPEKTLYLNVHDPHHQQDLIDTLADLATLYSELEDRTVFGLEIGRFTAWRIVLLHHERDFECGSRELNSLAFALQGLLTAVDDMMHIDTAGKGQPQKARLTQAMRIAREALERLSQ